MKAYTALLHARVRTLLQYRAAAWAGFVTQLFWGWMRVMIFEAFYRSSTATPPMELRDVITYVWLGQAMLLLVPFGPDPEVREQIRSGHVAYELLRPLDLYGLWFARCLAARIAPVLMRAIPMFIVAGLFFGLRAPASTASGAAWVASTLSAMLLSGAFATLVTVSLLLTISGEGISRVLPTLSWILSGIMIPIPLFPDWAQAVLLALPFRGLADTPFRIYVGHITPAEALPAIAHQLLWAAVFIALGRWMVVRAQKRMVIQGG